MKKKTLGMRFFSMVLALSMVITSSALPTNVTTVFADQTASEQYEFEEISANSVSDNEAGDNLGKESIEDEAFEVDTNLLEMDEDLDDTLDEDSKDSNEDEGLKSNYSLSENSLQEFGFKTLYKENAFGTTEEGVSFDASRKDGIFVSAKNGDLKNTVFTFSDCFDFKETSVDYLYMDMLASRATKTKVEIYKDDEETPFETIRLVSQNKDGNWERQSQFAIDISSYNLTGTHTFTFKLIDETTKDSKNTTVLLRSMQFVHSTIPVVELNIDESFSPISSMNGDYKHETECYGDVKIKVPEHYASEFDSANTFVGGQFKLDYIRGRGNSTWTVDKKPYKIKLDKAANLFGMGENKHWVLLANHYDNSLVRNRMTYKMGRDLGMAYTPKCVSVDVYMNQEYLGSYLLCEQIRIGKNRVDIHDLESEYEDKEMTEESDLSGGYMLSMSPYGNEMGYAFETEHGMYLYVDSPESTYETSIDERRPDNDGFFGDFIYAEGDGALEGNEPQLEDDDKKEENADDQNEGGQNTDGENTENEWEDTSKYALANAYISDYVQQVENAIYGEDFKTADGVSYEELMDVDSAVAYFWMQEFSNNGDAYVTNSTRLYKDKGGKLCWGPLWDFDYVAWASYDYSNFDENEYSYGYWNIANPWFSRLLQDPGFVEKMNAYWKTKLKPELEKVVVQGGLLDQYESELAESAERNFSKWGYTCFDYDVQMPDSSSLGYHDEIERLRKWINYRMNWVDENLDSLKPIMVTVKFMDGENQIDSYRVPLESSYLDFPVDPVPLKEGDVFGGWYYTTSYTDEETNEEVKVENRFLPGDGISQWMLDETGVLVLNAKWLDPSEITPVDLVHFEQSEYVFTYSRYNYDNAIMFKLPYAIAPMEALDSLLSFESSDPTVATIDTEANVSIVGPGTTTITAKTTEGKTFSTQIRVIDISDIDDAIFCNNFELSDTSLEMNVGEQKGITISTTPEDGGNYEFIYYEWASSNSEVVTVQNGLLNAVAPGEAVVLVRGVMEEENMYRFCRVVVKEESAADDPEAPKKEYTDENQNTTNNDGEKQNGDQPETTKEAKVGDKFVKGNVKYVISKTGKNPEVIATGAVKEKTFVTIPDKVKEQGTTYLVTGIKANAFASKNKVKKITIGANVKEIGVKAFAGCKNCKKIILKSKKLKKVGKQAFKGLSKKATVTLPKKKAKTYRKWFKGYTIKKK